MWNHHEHNHNSVKNIKLAFFLNLLFTIIEFIGWFFTNSVAIMSDALHDLWDSFSLGLAWFLEKYSHKKRNNTFSEYKFPLTFSYPKKYYSPKYQNYKNSFFKNFGVLDWLPINKINRFGDYNLKIENNHVENMILFIEGISHELNQTRCGLCAWHLIYCFFGDIMVAIQRSHESCML